MARVREISIGGGPNDLLHVAGLPAQSAFVAWDGGLVVRAGSAHEILVEGRRLLGGQGVRVERFDADVRVDGRPVSLKAPELAALLAERIRVPGPGEGVLLGRDPSRVHVAVAHASVSGVHARIDPVRATVVDLGSTSGTWDAAGRQLPANAEVPMGQGIYLGAVWLDARALCELALTGAVGGAPAAAGAAAGQAPGVLGGAGLGLLPGAPRAVQLPAAGAGPAPGPAPGPARAAPQISGTGTLCAGLDLGGAGAGPAEITIGRDASCQIELPFPQVSRFHAKVTRRPDGAVHVEDLGSGNGTFVRGQRLRRGESVPIGIDERFLVGPYPLRLGPAGALRAAPAVEPPPDARWGANLVAIEAIGVRFEVPDREGSGAMRTLLDDITFKALPGDFIALMGPSGAGKTTLLMVLNGTLRPTVGQVRVNGEDLFAIYDALRGCIGYVPQDDLLHAELTVEEAIYFSARMRLPRDFTDDEIARRVGQTIADLGLEQVRHLQIGKPEKKVLSGGQRKRVNIALELVTDPPLLFLDEPTSGLAADDTVALIDLLRDLARASGKTIISTIHQPARDEYEKFNLAFVLAYGGTPAYFGPTGEPSYRFFGRQREATGQPALDNPRDMFDMLRRREQALLEAGAASRDQARRQAAHSWRAEFFRPDNPVYQQMVAGPRAPGAVGTRGQPTRATIERLAQLRLLLERYAVVKLRDRGGLAILLLQAPIIGALIAAVFGGKAEQPSLWCKLTVEKLEHSQPGARQLLDCMTKLGRFPEVRDFAAALFLLVVASIWFGTSNAAREIVAEQAIYRRERMVNLSIANYVASKFAVLSCFSAVQCTVLLVIVKPALGLSGGFLATLGILIVCSVNAVSIGLLISAVVRSTEAATALTPIALIPQVILGGMIVRLTEKDWLGWVMGLMPARWGFEAALGLERAALDAAWRIPVCGSISDASISDGAFRCATEELASTVLGEGGYGFEHWAQPLAAVGVLVLLTAVALGAVLVILRRRDVA
ncbi:MAG: ATP-binding cassette domain-containing protein [Deltaproteobacteria bacterium]|nr:ATP-binding cassette domain-containing protein [Deltaproteobacteria bacterium]